MSNYRIALKQNQDRIIHLIEDCDRQITLLDREIAEKDQNRQSLMEMKAVLRDYSRLHALELAGK